MGARSILTPNPEKKRIFHKRQGIPTKAEKELVAQFVADQTCEITPAQVQGLAKTFRRSKAVIKQLIEDAKENFVVSAGRYVEIHKAATEAALASGDNEQALKGSQWALTNLSAEGARIIDKQTTEPTGARVIVGIRLGGIEQPNTVIALPKEVLDGKTEG